MPTEKGQKSVGNGGCREHIKDTGGKRKFRNIVCEQVTGLRACASSMR